MTPPKRKRRTVAIDEMVKGAFERNGVNTILLDIRDGLTEVVAKVAHLEQREAEARESRGIMHNKLDDNTAICSSLAATVGRIAPLVDQHEALVQQKIGERRLIGKAAKMITAGRAAVIATFGAGGLASYWHWEKIAALWRH